MLKAEPVSLAVVDKNKPARLVLRYMSPLIL